MKSIAVIARSIAWGDALKQHLAKHHPGATINVVSKISDVPAGSEIGARGLPPFVMGNQPVVFHSVGLRYDKNETEAQRKARSEKVADENATVQEILPELGYVDEVLVFPARAYAEAKNIVTQARLNIAEAGDTTEEQLAAYKAGFNALKNIFIEGPKPMVKTEVESLVEEEPPL